MEMRMPVESKQGKGACGEDRLHDRTMNANDLKQRKKDDFPSLAHDKIRYSDTDRQGHVNNAVFSAFLETGRVEILYDPKDQLAAPGCSFVIASLSVDLLGELSWPGTVTIATGIARIGTSSIGFAQGLYQDDRLCAVAETTIVQVDDATKRSFPLTGAARAKLGTILLQANQV